MSFAEIPVDTDAEVIKAMLKEVFLAVEEGNDRLDRIVAALNSLGENVNWLTTNTQGVFQMLGSPMFMQQIGSMMGGMSNGGPAEAGE